MTPRDVVARRADAIEYAARFIGQPYRWGGEDPVEGFDCSGFICEDLQMAGVVPHRYRTTANGLKDRFHGYVRPLAEYADRPGLLGFWLDENGYATHVEMRVGRGLAIGASGAGSSTAVPSVPDVLGPDAATASRADRLLAEIVAEQRASKAAADADAFVKVRPWHYRGEPDLVLDPFASLVDAS